MLQGIKALVQVMQSEVTEYLESDVLTASGVRCENNLADLNNMSETVTPDLDRVPRACNSLVSESFNTRTDASLPVQDSIIQREKLVYTVLNSKNKFHPNVSNARSCGINKTSSNTSLCLRRVVPDARPNPDLTGPSELPNPTMKSTFPSTIHKIPSSSNNAGLTLNALSSSARSNPNPRITRPNEPLPACDRLTTWKFQKILPKSLNAHKNSPTRHKHQPANSLLYQLLKRSTPLTSEMQQKPPQCVSNISKFPSTKLAPNSSSTKPGNYSTKCDVKARKKCKNRKSSTKPVESFVSRESSSYDECLSKAKVHLAKEDLWKLFYEKENEMIVSKPGRPIFPRLDLSVSGLDPDEMYSIAVRLVRVDKYRYQYKTSLDSWEQTYEDTHQAGHPRCFEHPQSPANGQTLNAKLLSFMELRVTNRATKSDNMVYAPTMRKHRFQLVVTMLRCSRCQVQHTRYIDVPLTEFIAVSSYYSLVITELKITHNPLAKMRRSNAQHKRKSCKSSEDVPTFEAKKQKTGKDSVNPGTIAGEAKPQLCHAHTQLNNSTHIAMPSNKHVHTTMGTQLSTIPNILQSTSNSQLSTMSSIVSPNVLRCSSSSLDILPSTSSAELPLISDQVTSVMKPARHCLPSSTATYTQPAVTRTTENPKSPVERCNTVYTCQTTKPTARVQTDDDILEFIDIYLSPFLTTEKNENLDSSVFDELYDINSISEKMDNFSNCNLIQECLPLC